MMVNSTRSWWYGLLMIRYVVVDRNVVNRDYVIVIADGSICCIQ